MPTEVPDVYFVLFNNATAITAQSEAELTTTADIVDVLVKNDLGFMGKLSGDNEWSISHTGFLVTDTGAHFLVGKNNTASLSVDTGGGTFAPIEGIQSASLTLTQELAETPPGIDEDVTWRNYRPTRRMWSLEAEGFYYNLSDSATYQAFVDAKENGENIDIELTVAGLTFAGSLAPEDFSITAGSSGENATVSISGQGHQVLTQTGTAETTIGNLLDAYFNQSLLSVEFQQLDASGAQVDQSTVWAGDVYLSEATIDIARNEQVELSLDLQGDGALTNSTYTAA